MVVDPEVVVMGVEVVVMGVEVVVVPTMKWAVWVVKTLVTRTMAYHDAVNLKKWGLCEGARCPGGHWWCAKCCTQARSASEGITAWTMRTFNNSYSAAEAGRGAFLCPKCSN